MISEKKTILGVVGSRRRSEECDFQAVERFITDLQPDRIVSGGCPVGGDYFAKVIANKFNIPITVHMPKWNKYGRRAGLVRNTLIAEEADILLACVAADRKGGTEDTIRKFIKLKPFGQLILV